MMRTLFVILFALALLPALSQAQGNLPPVGDNWESTFTNGIVAVVNHDIITADQLRQELRPIVPHIQRTSLTREEFDKKLEEASFDVLRNMVDRILIVQDFKKEGYTIPKVYVDKEYDDYIVREFNGDRMAFHEWLRRESKTPRSFREELQDRMVVDYMRGRMRKSQSAVSPARIIEYYERNKHMFFEKERVHLYQIMLKPVAGETTENLVAKAQDILKEYANNDVTFANMARKYSQDDNAKDGGDWGWIEREDLAPELAQKAFSLEVDVASQPIVKSGYVFILYVKERRDSGAKALSEVKEQIEQALAGELAREAQKLWLDRLRQAAYIRYYL